MKFYKWRDPYSLCCGSDIISVYFALYTHSRNVFCGPMVIGLLSHSLLASHLSQWRMVEDWTLHGPHSFLLGWHSTWKTWRLKGWHLEGTGSSCLEVLPGHQHHCRQSDLCQCQPPQGVTGCVCLLPFPWLLKFILDSLAGNSVIQLTLLPIPVLKLLEKWILLSASKMLAVTAPWCCWALEMPDQQQFSLASQYTWSTNLHNLGCFPPF